MPPSPSRGGWPAAPSVLRHLGEFAAVGFDLEQLGEMERDQKRERVLSFGNEETDRRLGVDLLGELERATGDFSSLSSELAPLETQLKQLGAQLTAKRKTAKRKTAKR